MLKKINSTIGKPFWQMPDRSRDKRKSDREGSASAFNFESVNATLEVGIGSLIPELSPFRGEVRKSAQPWTDQHGAIFLSAADLRAASNAGSLATETYAPTCSRHREAARILVVDDVDINLEIVEAYLEGCGYFVDTVDSATEAIRRLDVEFYDLILMDIQMPVMDGVTATQTIRGMSTPARNIPILAMTGNVLPQQVTAFLAAGMNDHVGKPIVRAKLLEKVARWLTRADGPGIGAARGSAHFDQAQLDELVTLLGAAKVEATASVFLERLTQAFKTTAKESRREAHGLINCAGLMGFPRLVEACQEIETMSSDNEYRQRMTLARSVRVQSVARHRLLNQVLPSLRGMLALRM